MYHKNIYICSNETTNSKGHTHLAALSGRKERLLEAGHCCARISVVGSSFFRLTRCERFPELCAWGGFNFREKIRFISYPPKRQLNLPTIWVLYIHEKMDQSKGRRRLEATQQPGQLLEAQSNTQTSRSAAARGIARNGDVPMWHNAARPRSLQSTNVRRKDDKKGVMMTSYRSIFLNTIARQIRKFEYRK